MKKMKLLSLLLAMLMVLSLLAGCGSQESEEAPTDAPTEAPAEVKPELDDLVDPNASLDILPEAEAPTATATNEFGGLSAEKIGNLNVYRIENFNENGLVYYDENGVYGIATLDGSHDTGAIYQHCSAKDHYFLYTNTTADINDISTLNCYGVLDVMGNEIVPAQYASIQILNERYIRVCEVTELADNQDEALVYYADSAFQVFADEDDTFFKGNWYVYDVTTGKLLEGVSGTKAVTVSASGNFVTFYNDDSERLIVNDKGQLLPDNGYLFDDGSYVIENDDQGVFYATDGTPLFDYDPDGYSPDSIQGDYIRANKYVDSGSVYVLMDYEGNIVSAEFPKHIYVYGNLIHCENTVYDFSGNVVYEGAVESVTYDDTFGKAFFLRDDKTNTMITADGSVLMQAIEDDTIGVYRFDFVAYDKIEDEYYCYSHKDKDYTIAGYSFGPWLAKGYDEPSGTYNIIDTITGEVILSGFRSYYPHSVPGVGSYIYTTLEDGGYDIYLVK